MNVSAADAQRVDALLGSEIAALRAFVSVLQEEQQALAAGQLERLLPLAQDKTQLSEKLSALDDDRMRAVGWRDAADHSEEMAAWLQSAGQPHLDIAWRQLLELAARARDLNAVNGRLIAERMRHNQQALAILLAAGDAADLYGPDGQPRLGNRGRSLGSA